MESPINFSNLENFLDSAEAILMQKIEEANLDTNTQFNLKVFEIAILRQQVKEIILKYVKNPETDQWVFELLKRVNRFSKSLKQEKLCHDLNTLDWSNWLNMQETIITFRHTINEKILGKLRDKDYYANAQKVQSDLQAFSIQANVPIEKLNTHNISSLQITCTNGEKVIGPTYLKNASRALEFSKDDIEDGKNQHKALQKLLKSIGIKVEEYTPRDEKYYTNAQKVQSDLQAFSVQAKVPIEKLIIQNISSLQVTCANGEKVIGITYMRNAARQLKLSKNRKEDTAKQNEALKKLLRTVGIKVEEYTPRDEKYYTNARNINDDLEGLSKIVFKEKYIKGQSLLMLNTSHFSENDVTCANGEKVSGTTYLRNASRKLGFSKNRQEDGGKQKDTIQALVKIASSIV